MSEEDEDTSSIDDPEEQRGGELLGDALSDGGSSSDSDGSSDIDGERRKDIFPVPTLYVLLN